MNDDVREVMWTALHRDWARLMLTPGDAIDVALAALTDAGYRFAGPDEVIVERWRFVRLEDVARHGKAYFDKHLGPLPVTPIEDDETRWFGLAVTLLENGDLDPIPEAMP